MFGALFGAIRGCIGQHAYRPGSPVARKPCVVSTDAEEHLRDISVSAEAEQESSAGAECAVSGGRLRPTTGVIGEMRVRPWNACPAVERVGVLIIVLVSARPVCRGMRG